MSRQLIREVLRENPELCDQLLEEGVFQDAWDWLKKKGKNAKQAVKNFLNTLRQEWSETKSAGHTVAKIVKGKPVSKEEKKELSDQTLDLVKGAPLAGLFLLPGGGLAVGAVIKVAKKLGIDMRPSSFK